MGRRNSASRGERMRDSVGRDILASSSPLLPRTIGDAIAQHAVHDPDRPAIVGTAFSSFSFREFDAWIKQTGHQLRTAGIGPHSRVGIMLPPGPEGAVLAVAVASHAISVSLNPNRPETEIEDELARVGLDALVLPSRAESPGLAIARTSSFGLFGARRRLAQSRAWPCAKPAKPPRRFRRRSMPRWIRSHSFLPHPGQRGLPS